MVVNGLEAEISAHRVRRSYDAMMALIVVLAIVVLGFGLDRVVRYVSGESRAASGVPSPVIPRQADITIVDGPQRSQSSRRNHLLD